MLYGSFYQGQAANFLPTPIKKPEERLGGLYNA
jgi:hypothetical protein